MPSPTDPAPLAWKTVLLVENDEPLREIGVQLLELAGAEAFACAGAEEARALLREVLPDYVITDIELPDDGGRALAADLHGEPDLAGIFVIALAPPSMPRHALVPEFDAVLYKPHDYEQMLEVLASLKLPEDRPLRRFIARPGDRVFVRDGGESRGLVHAVREDGIVVELAGTHQVFVPGDALVARHQGKVLVDVSRLPESALPLLR